MPLLISTSFFVSYDQYLFYTYDEALPYQPPSHHTPAYDAQHPPLFDALIHQYLPDHINMSFIMPALLCIASSYTSQFQHTNITHHDCVHALSSFTPLSHIDNMMRVNEDDDNSSAEFIHTPHLLLRTHGPHVKVYKLNDDALQQSTKPT